jgi:long-chain fatty acid transport protein
VDPRPPYITQQINDKWWAGFGIFSRFGLGTQFDPNWPGRYNSYYARIRTVELNPNIAYKVNEKFSVAGGFNLMYFDLKLEQKINAGTFGGAATTYPNLPDANSTMEGDAWGWGFNLAMHYKPTEDWMLGVSYRSRVSQKITEGDADFTKPPQWAAFGATNAVLLRDTKASGGLHLPDEVFAGIAGSDADRNSGRRRLLDALEQLRQTPDHVQAGLSLRGRYGHQDKELGRRLPLHDRRRVEVHAQLEAERQLCIRPGTDQRPVRGLSGSCQRP